MLAMTASDIGRGDNQQRRRRTCRICWSIMVSRRGVRDVDARNKKNYILTNDDGWQKNVAVSGIMQAKIAWRTVVMTPQFVGMRRGKKPQRRNGVGRRASMNCSRWRWVMWKIKTVLFILLVKIRILLGRYPNWLQDNLTKHAQKMPNFESFVLSR